MAESADRRPSPASGRASTSARARLGIGVLLLATVWGVAFNVDAVPILATVLAGAVVGAGLGLWTRAASDAPAPLPRFGLRASQVGLALVVAVVHYLVGWGLFEVGVAVLPALGSMAGNLYGESTSLLATIVLGGLLTAPLEEMYWRGALQPVLARRLAGVERVIAGVPVATVVASAAAYAAFHVVTLRLPLVLAGALGGLVWAWLTERTGSVATAMIAHAAWTTLMIAFPIA